MDNSNWATAEFDPMALDKDASRRPQEIMFSSTGLSRAYPVITFPVVPLDLFQITTGSTYSH